MLAALLLALASTAASPRPSAPVAAIRFDGRTTAGETRSFPGDANGKPLILVVGLDRKAARDTSRWSEALQDDLGTRADIVGVAVLDRVPGFARGFVERAIDKQLGPPKPGSAGFVTTFDGSALRAAAPTGDDALPVLYVFRGDGSLLSAERSAFSSDEERRVAKSVREPAP